MSKTATIQARIDPEVKKQAKAVLDRLHLSMSEAISMFLTQVSLQKGIPFEVKIPNELTEKTLRKAEQGKDLHLVENVETMFKDLDR
jgi:DNA-damage-inducible protein J